MAVVVSDWLDVGMMDGEPEFPDPIEVSEGPVCPGDVSVLLLLVVVVPVLTVDGPPDGRVKLGKVPV